MSDIKQRLDQIKPRILEKGFLENEGLSNEVGIYIFQYDPKDELIVQAYVQKITEGSNPQFKIVKQDLYELFLRILEEKRVLPAISDMELKKGKDFLLQQLQKIASPKEFLDRMKKVEIEKRNVLFLTGVGQVYPFMRAHKVLDNMQHMFENVPIIMFYPGEFTGQSLSLFNEFSDGNYYRAFNLLIEEKSE
ncbi:putative cytoplasmic protein [Lactococcus lactis subsp. lactis]|uniref:DUF1788 domain-containing protein n=1 Tax=Lactococcus lactis TaxID=1358 RepID=UPI00071D223E|nr:DUF1788 domain-containing protein [Lactococcus lactis]KST91110.1 putative cytoplasmic protein [Lactococcus lactis subsp. lactis]